jgi:hypothetical protein
MVCTAKVSGNKEHYNDLKALRLTAFCWPFTDLLDLIGYVDGHDCWWDEMVLRLSYVAEGKGQDP